MALRVTSVKSLYRTICINPLSRAMSGGEWGSGAGKGGGSGGSIRESGGSFGKMESAREEEYFRKKQREQFDEIKDHLHDEIMRNEKMIKEHEEAIKKAKKKIEDLKH